MRRDAVPEDRPVRDLALYKRLISDGIADADKRRGNVDHITARRMAICLLAQPQERDFMVGLIWFARSGTITRELKTQLRKRARSPRDPTQPQAARLLQYAVARGTDLGPIGSDFAGLCDQIDWADAILDRLRERVGDGRGLSEATSPNASGEQPTAIARRDPGSRTVSFILDETTAKAAICAITGHAVDREAHMREVKQQGQNFPEGSYGRCNRQAIADHETRIAERLRAIERAYRTALDHDPMGPHSNPLT